MAVLLVMSRRLSSICIMSCVYLFVLVVLHVVLVSFALFVGLCCYVFRVVMNA